MSIPILSIAIMATISIGLLFIYIYGALIRYYGQQISPWEQWIAGALFGTAAGFSIVAARVLFNGSAIDGKFAFLAVGTAFFELPGAAVILAAILMVFFVLDEPVTLFFTVELITVTGIGLVCCQWLKKHGYRKFYGVMVLMGFLIVIQNIIWSLVFPVSMAFSGTGLYDTVLAMAFVPLVTAATGGIFLADRDRRAQELELTQTKDSLTTQNEEITALYEEMSAAEEMLQEQYDQLEKNRQEIIRINDRYRLIYQAGNEGLWEYDYATKETYLSDRLTEIYGYGPEKKAFMNKERDSLIHPLDLPMVYEKWRALKQGLIQSYDMEYRILHISGEYRWIQAKGTILRDEDGKNLLMAGSHADIHERRMEQQKLYESAYYDRLTGLPNRDWFVEKLAECIAATVEVHGIGAVLILGLDDFKAVNDAMGLVSGDEVLRAIGSRLLSCQNEKRFAARLSGDEFLILLSDTQQRYEIEAEIHQVLELIHQPITFNEVEIILTASLGAVLFPKDAHTTDKVLQNGSIALQQAKLKGRNASIFFDDRMAKDSMRHLRLEAGLKTAFENKEYSVDYQPIFGTENLKLTGFEVLVRWHSPEFGLVSPDEFIKKAEQNGRIVELGNWVLQESCSMLQAMDRIALSNIYISVNLSPVQLMQKDFVAQVKEIITSTKVSPNRIVFEITETALMESFETSNQKICALKDWGIGFALDDFGTGYSSLSYLRSLPVNTLKIDKCFIDDICDEWKLQKMVRSIIDISHDLELKVVAEGVESQTQLKLLKNLGCDFIQGYLLGAPGSEKKALTLMESSQ